MFTVLYILAQGTGTGEFAVVQGRSLGVELARIAAQHFLPSLRLGVGFLAWSVRDVRGFDYLARVLDWNSSARNSLAC